MRNRNPILATALRILFLAWALGWVGLFVVRAAEVTSFSFEGKIVRSEEVTGELKPILRAMRFNEALEEWNLDVVVTNTGARRFPLPVFLVVEAGGNTIGLLDQTGLLSEPPSLPFIAVSSFVAGSGYVIEPGKTANPVTLRLGYLDDGASPTVTIRVFGNPEGEAPLALALTRSLNEVGQPLPEVRVQESGPKGSRQLVTDRETGVITLGQDAGLHVWRFDRDGFLSAWRIGELRAGQVELVPNPRLVRRPTPGVAIGPLGTSIQAGDAVGVQLPPGGVSQTGEAFLAVFDPQSLPAPLPEGWSPLRGFWWLASVPLQQPVQASLLPEGPLLAAESAALCRWNESLLVWEVSQVVEGKGAAAVQVSLPTGGAYVLAVGDSGNLAPPPARVGQPLLPSRKAAPEAKSLSAVGTASPLTATASPTPELVTARGMVTLTSSNAPIPSGFVLRGEVRESYLLQDGSQRFVPAYEHHLVGYQRPGDGSNTTVHSSFPMRPLLLYGSQELSEARVTVDILAPTAFPGAVLRPSGGSIQSGRLSLRANAGTFARPQAALLTPFLANRFDSLLPPGLVGIAAFDLLLSEVEAGRRLDFRMTRLPPRRFLVLARVLTRLGASGLEPIERFQTSTNGALESLEPSAGARLPGIRGAGQYLLVEVENRPELITGRVTDGAGRPVASLPVRIAGFPWMTFTQPDGLYLLVAPAGSAQIVAEDLETYQSDVAAVTVVPNQATAGPLLALADRGPRVVNTVPEDHAERVGELTPITVSVSEPLKAASLAARSIRLVRSDGTDLGLTLSLNLRGTVVSVIPAEPLPSGETLRLVLSPQIQDRLGKPLEGPMEFRFSTQARVARGELAKLTIFQPGATNLLLPDGVDVRALIPSFDQIANPKASVVAYGSAGTADGRVPVILANETTGETSTVLSKADGSFAGIVAASEEDFVTATFVNANGTRTSVSATRQQFDDGRVGLYQAGGTLEAQSDGGKVQVQVEPGAVKTRTEFKVEAIPLNELLALVQGQQPLGGKLLGGLRYQESADGLNNSVDVSFPVKISELGLPAGVSPESRGYALVVPAKYDNTIVYEVLDTMVFEPTAEAGAGRLVTHSPPFPGLLAKKLAQLRDSVRRIDKLGMVKTSETSPGKQAVSTGAGVVALDQPLSQGAKIAGHVRSALVDSQGQPVDPQKLVAGAIVVADLAGTQRPKGFLRPGELVVTSDAEGAFALFLRPSEQSQAHELVASHPRFSFQTARAAVLLDPNNTAIGRADLLFAEGNGSGGAVAGSAPAVVRASHFPLLPAIGSGEGSITKLTVLALDDVEVSRPSLTVVSAETPNGVPLNSDAVIHVEEEAEARASASSTIQSFKIRADVAAKVKLKSTVSDDGGTETTLDYTIQFGLSAGEIPSDPTGHPSVVLAWPPDGATRVPSLSPILIRFSKPIAEGLLSSGNVAWATFDADHRLRFISPSADRREVTLYYDGAVNGEVRLTVNTIIDQDPNEEGNQAFSFRFTQSGQRTGSLEEGEMGGGIAFQGRFGFALERRSSGGGRVLSFDLAKPAEPVEADSFSFDQRPATLALISEYPLPSVALDGSRRPVSTGCDLASLLAVFTGGPTELKRLHLLRLSAEQPGRFSAAKTSIVLSRSESSQIVKSRWDAPFLGYLELDSDVTSLTLLDLASIQVATQLRREDLERLPAEGAAGLDANGDGDYCDAGDRLPIPLQDSAHPAGFSFSFAPENPKERIQDFDHLSDKGLVGVVTSFPDHSRSNRFRVVLAAQLNGTLDQATVDFPIAKLPKRLVLLRSVVLQTATNRLVKDLALVSLAREDGSDGSLSVIDLSNPDLPRQIAEIPLPAGEGQPNTIVRRLDGLLALATTRGLLLLDPSRLLLPLSIGRHPAFTQNIELAAGGVRDFVSDPSGLNAVFQGGVKKVVQVEPRMQIVVFNRDPLAPTNLVELPSSAVNAILAKSRPVGVVELSPTDSKGEVIADLSPDRQHYVLVDAPGSAGGEAGQLPIVIAAINRNGALYERNSRNPAPSIIGDRSVQNALFLRQLLKICRAAASALDGGEVTGVEISPADLFVSLLRNSKARQIVPDLQAFARMWASLPSEFNARRLSDNPSSPLYNRFLAGPFMVLPRSPEEGVVRELRQQAEQRRLGRAYLRASPQLWVGLQKDFRENEVLGQFASVFTIGSDLTLAGQRLPILSRLGERLLNYLTEDHDVLAPVALEALQLALRAVGDAPVLNQIGIDYHPNLLPGASLLKPVAYSDRPLVFIPGFGGSRLQGVNGEFWPSILGLREDDSVLQLTPAGNTFEKQVAGDALRSVIEAGPVRLLNIYGLTIQQLKDDLGYTEYDFVNPKIPGDKLLEIQSKRRNFRGSPTLNQAPAPDLFVFAYDWRQDNTRAADLLQDYVNLIRYYHPEADGIEVIAHSNGNLVARKYINDHPGVVKRYLSIAAPFLGSGKPILGMLTGDMQDVGLNLGAPIGVLRRAMQFMPGAHQLICNRGIFELGAFPIEESGFDLNHNGASFERYRYAQFAEAMEQFLFKETHAELLHRGPSPSRANHERFHAPDQGLPIADWSRDDASIELHHIIGMQTVARSPLGVRFVGRLHQNRSNVNNVTLNLPSLQPLDSEEGVDPNRWVASGDGLLGITTNQFRFHPDLELLKTLGDGTVPILSLSRGFGSALSLNAPHANLYCAVSRSPDRDSEAGHNPMLMNPVVQGWVRRIMEGRRISILQPQINAPAVTGEGRQFELSISPGSATGEPATGQITTVIDFGDGTSSSRVSANGGGVSARHRYRQDGVYVISVGVTGDNGVSGFTSHAVEVTNAPPTVQFNPTNTTVALNDTLLFSVKVADLGADDQHRMSWSLDGQPLPGRHGAAAFVRFLTLGNHQLRVEAADAEGGIGRAAQTIRVVAGPVPAVPPPSPAGDEDAPVTRPFEEQPTALLRITGQKPGPFDTLGVVVRERGAITFDRVEVPLPVRILPVLGGLIADFFQTADLASRFTRYLARTKTALIDSVVQRTATNSTVVELVQVLDQQNGPALKSTVEVETLGGPLELELLYSQGGVPVQLTRWTTNAPPDLPVSLDFVWQDSNGTPQSEASLKVGNDRVPKRFEALGPAAGDRQPPSVAAVFNPATGNLQIVARDNFTLPEKIELFLAQDSSGDGRLEDEVFYQLGTNVLVRARLPSRKFAIVGRDEAGNVSEMEPFLIEGTSDYTLANKGAGGFCEDLVSIAGSIKEVIQLGLDSEAVHDLFLLDPAHLWVFEQGSGACLWKPDSCAACNGNFVPGVSDNDYELFFPVHLGRSFDPRSDADRVEFLAQDAHAFESRKGDWYFRPPEGVDDSGEPVSGAAEIKFWRYTLPPGFTSPLGASEIFIPNQPSNGNLALGFDRPLVPAEIISRTFTRVIADSSRLNEILEQTTFFPARREHFVYGRLDLELPPEDGPDPLGDGGCGRGLLLLKWALEGEFVTLPASMRVNQGLPSLDLVYSNLKRAGIPAAEGFEWGVFQEFAALKGGVTVDVHATYGPEATPQALHSAAGNSLEQQQQKKLKKMGKSAIRAAIARVAGDPDASSLIFSIDRRAYSERHLASFEDYILNVITNNADVGSRLFPGLIRDRATQEGPDLVDFLRAKKADAEFFEELLRDPQGYQRFIQGGFQFLRDLVQAPTRLPYDAYLQRLSIDGHQAELAQREANLQAVVEGKPPGQKGLKDLIQAPEKKSLKIPVSLANFTAAVVSNERASASTGSPQPRPQGDPPADRTEQVPISAVGALSGEAEGDDFDEPTIEMPLFEDGAATQVDVRIQDGAVEGDPVDDNFIRVIAENHAPAPNPNVPKPRLKVLIDFLLEDEGPFVRFRGVAPDGSAVSPAPKLEIRFIRAGAQGRQVLSADRFNLEHLPTELGGVIDIEVAAVPQSNAFAEGHLPMVTSLLPLFRDGVRVPSPGETQFLDALNSQFPLPQPSSDAAEYLELMFALLKPLWEEIVNAPTLAVFDSFAPSYHIKFATSELACAEINKKLGLGPATPDGKIFFNPGRQQLGNRVKTGQQGIIYMNSDLRLPGDITILNGGPVPRLDVIRVETLHELNVRSVKLVRNGKARTATLTRGGRPLVMQEHQLLDQIGDGFYPVLQRTISRYPDEEHVVEPEPECP